MNDANAKMLQGIQTHNEKKQAIEAIDSQIKQMKNKIQKYEADLEKRQLIQTESNQKIKV